ncbi:MAG TPA: ferrous iron transport protein B, partial [Polyangiaceae bacterium]|nr:ferrous iron transport protein B [Polyangiaceae bacterium]
MNSPLRTTPAVALLLGNPNVGKTSLFNALTSSRARVGNYPGITVDRRSGRVDTPQGALEVVDVPGTYSLNARSREEQITIDALLGLQGEPRPDLLIAVVDAGQLGRCLYFVSQLLELGIPLVVALNMADEVGPDAPSAEKLEARLGVPVVRTQGQTGQGADELVRRALERLTVASPAAPGLYVRRSDALRHDLDRVAEALPESWRGSVERDRALGQWALGSLDEVDELEGIPSELRARVKQVTAEAQAAGRDLDLEIAAARYAVIDALLAELGGGVARERLAKSERIDRVLLHPFAGSFAFGVTMLVVFQALFVGANPAIDAIEAGIGWISDALRAVLPPGVLTDLLLDGALLGVGNVLVFLPQILLLFLFVGLLEDSGYMARGAYLVDRIMRSLGLHGRAFVPLVSGFACAIPAILATRTLERRRDRLLTMLVVPLMTCSARLPVYSLIIAALFPVGSIMGLPVQGLLLLTMYLFSSLISLLAAWVLGRTVVRGTNMPLLLELPPYRLPRLGPTLRSMVEKARQFLSEAGTVILAATVALWVLLSFPRHVDTNPCAPADTACVEEASKAATLDQSYGARLGKTLEPVMAPLGFDWKMTTGIIGAFAAREVFVSTLALVYGLGDVADDEALPLRDQIRRERHADGTPVYTPLVGLSLMIFFALACQCMSTLAVVKRETGGYRWPAFLFAYMTALAYLMSF